MSCDHRFILVLLLILGGCAPGQNESETCDAARAFFKHYQDRNDWEGFLDRYHPEVEFSDIILQLDLEGINEFQDFYNWPDTLFRKHPAHPSTLSVTTLVCERNTAVARGFFNPFYYGDIFYSDTAHMRFTMWLEFDSDGLITRHIDYIEYPPKILRSVADRLLSEQDSTSLR